jgi:hypothetical protein
MPPKPITERSEASPNTLFYGDNLPILREYARTTRKPVILCIAASCSGKSCALAVFR